ncbi:MAG: AMP-dependent synthetase, partial [Acidimicrobiales bacterium]|nr:AMP-dependent synthetase [Acidimicrobiales bacterium]
MVTWNLADLFESVADAVPEREAIVAGTRRFTYAELDERANRLAHVLCEAGVGPGDHVGLALRNGCEYVEGTLAAFKLRAVPVNVNYRYTVDELRYLLTDADVAALIMDPDLVERVHEATGGLVRTGAELVRGPQYEAALAAAPAHRPPVTRRGDDLYVLYTGGTTGHPKGVMWRHQDVFFAALGGGNPGGEPVTKPEEVAERARVGRTRLLPASPLTHGAAHWTSLSTLLNGGTVILVNGTFQADVVWTMAEQERASVLVIVGDAFARPLADALAAEPDRWALDELLVILSGGAILSPVVRTALLAHLPSAVVVDGYGTSETGGQGQMPVWPGQAGGALPRFHLDEDTAVLDDAGRPAPPGSGLVGRLARKGHIPVGYHGDPERTAATFPLIDGERWSVPGDLARVESDGSVTLLGRGSSSINSGGEKVFPEEVEAVLKAHPAVFDAVVIGLPDALWGEQVRAVVQLRPGHDVPAAELQDHCRTHLADFKVPRRVVLVDVVPRR